MKSVPLFLALLLASSACFALGVSPAQQLLDRPGTHEFIITVRNGGETGSVSIRANGDLSDSITFDRTIAPFTGDVVFKGTVEIPENLEPGDHMQSIVISLASEGDNSLNAAVETVSLLTVRKLFKDPYFVADLHTSSDNGLLDTTNAVITIQNRGATALSPTVMLNMQQKTITVPSAEIGPGGIAQLNTVLSGRGEEIVELIVVGANEVRKNYTVAIGHPLISDFSARPRFEGGNITPIVVRAVVDWNKPVDALLLINGKSVPLVIDRQLEQTFYAEGNMAKLDLHVGVEVRTLDVVLKSAEYSSASFRWEWIALLVVLVVLCAFLFITVRKKA